MKLLIIIAIFLSGCTEIVPVKSGISQGLLDHIKEMRKDLDEVQCQVTQLKLEDKVGNVYQHVYIADGEIIKSYAKFTLATFFYDRVTGMCGVLLKPNDKNLLNRDISVTVFKEEFVRLK